MVGDSTAMSVCVMIMSAYGQAYVVLFSSRVHLVCDAVACIVGVVHVLAWPMCFNTLLDLPCDLYRSNCGGTTESCQAISPLLVAMGSWATAGRSGCVSPINSMAVELQNKSTLSCMHLSLKQ
jgi:hypothetical protein